MVKNVFSEGFSGTSTKDTWTKPKVGVGMAGWEGVVRGKWRQLYLNNNFKKVKKMFPLTLNFY